MASTLFGHWSKRSIESMTSQTETINSGPIAQLVEQLAFNQWVAGSSPAGLTTFLTKKHKASGHLGRSLFFFPLIFSNVQEFRLAMRPEELSRRSSV